MSEQVSVLDHGFVRLIDSMGSDLNISRNARVSYNAAPREEDTGLIKYLWKNGHTSPFESVVVTIEVMAPIFIFRQWHRHRTQSYNEISARYKELPEMFYVPEVEHITQQHKDNKQMRTDEQHPEAQLIQQMIREQCTGAFTIYKHLIEKGCPRELARSVLPTSTYSHMFATANLLNWFRFLGERLHPHAQWEIQQYAQAVVLLLKPIAPIAVNTFLENLDHG